MDKTTFRIINTLDNYFIAQRRQNYISAKNYLEELRNLIIEINQQDRDIFIGAPTLNEIENQLVELEE